MIVDQDSINLLKRNTFFHSVNQSFVDSFIKPKNFFVATDGTIIYSCNDKSSEIFLIVEGEVKIKCCGEKKIEYKYLLDFFGEKEVLDNSTRISSAIANKESILYRISNDELNSLISTYPVIEDNLKKIGSKQVTNTNKTSLV